ncbi:MAG: amidohydrolase family protein [Pirellulales bacterium]|nr:amidohydrolase family protein [Pirellulales bacterium]
MADPIFLKARYVFPVASPPLENGVVTISRGRIVAVESHRGPLWAPHSGRGEGDYIDYGDAAILPGLVNAHTHLEFSDLTAPIGAPGIGLAKWIRRLIDAKINRPANSKQCVIQGLDESLRQGVTTIGEIAQQDFPWEDLPNFSPSGVAFGELIAPGNDHVPAAMELARSLEMRERSLVREGDSPIFPAEKLGQSPSWRIGISPHAPYSVHPALLNAVIKISAEKQIPLAMHLAESREELQLLAERSGPLRELLEELGVWDPSAFSLPRRPMDYLQMLSAAYRVLVVHGNYLQDDEITLLARRADRFSVVYCPRSHAWFRHGPYPLEKLLAAGVNVALGTDSRASAPNLSLLAEMRFVARNFPKLPEETILRMGTLHSARALGLDRELGSLELGKWANLVVFSTPKHKTVNLLNMILQDELPVLATWYQGKKLICSSTKNGDK